MLKDRIPPSRGREGIPSASEPLVSGRFVEVDGQTFYRIEHFDRLQPFLIVLPSAADLWMYVSTNGGLSAGRTKAENCLLPYETVDKLHVCHTHTGPLTLLRWRGTDDQVRLWQPFADRLIVTPDIRRTDGRAHV